MGTTAIFDDLQNLVVNQTGDNYDPFARYVPPDGRLSEVLTGSWYDCAFDDMIAYHNQRTDIPDTDKEEPDEIGRPWPWVSHGLGLSCRDCVRSCLVARQRHTVASDRSPVVKERPGEELHFGLVRAVLVGVVVESGRPSCGVGLVVGVLHLRVLG